MEKTALNLHSKMKQLLRPIEWKVYKLLYIDHLEEEDVAKKMGYKTTEKNRSPGYKQIKNIKKSIITKVKEVIDRGDLDII